MLEVILDKKKPKVIIVDSGIDSTNDNLKRNIIGGISFQYCLGEDSVSCDSNYCDENGHGTFCASVIKRLVPDAGMYIVKILNRDAKTNSKTLIESLKYLQGIDIRLISLSLATVEEKYKEELKNVCDLLYKKGKIIICSLDNKSNKSYPACFDHVIGVRGSNLNCSNYFWYNSRYEIQCVADAISALVPSINNFYTMFGGNSKATALFSGIVLNILDKNPDITFEDLDNMLDNSAIRKYWSENDISYDSKPFDEISRSDKLYQQDDLIALENVLVRTLNLDEDSNFLLYKKKLYHPQIGVNRINCYEIIKSIEKDFNLKLNYDAISANTFNSIYSLLDFILEAKNV